MTSHQTSANAAIAMLGLARPVAANVVSDWNDKAVTFAVNHTMGRRRPSG